MRALCTLEARHSCMASLAIHVRARRSHARLSRVGLGKVGYGRVG